MTDRAAPGDRPERPDASSDVAGPAKEHSNGDDASSEAAADPPLEPSGIAQFVKHDRCPRYLKQRVDPGEEPGKRDWQEAFGVLNLALLGRGREFEATQVEALATGAATVIGPEIDDTAGSGVPDIAVDERWAASARDSAQQVRAAVREAAALEGTGDSEGFVLLYQPPVAGRIGAHEVSGAADVIVIAPRTQSDRPAERNHAADGHHPDPAPAEAADVVARVIDCKNATEERAAHRIQVATYCSLLEQTLGEGPAEPAVRIEASVLTDANAAAPGESLSPLSLPTFRRAEWTLLVSRLLEGDGPVAETLAEPLDALPFALDQVCDNCAYREACSVRAVEDPTRPASLAMLGLDATVQAGLHELGIDTLADLSEVLERPDRPHPTDDPPAPNADRDTLHGLEEVVPGPVHETVQRAQALRGEVDPSYPAYTFPPAITGADWIPLPDDRLPGWGGLDDADPGELIHVGLFVRPDTAIDRIGALGACVYAEAHGEYVTIGETIDALPDDEALAQSVERDLLDRFLDALFDAIESVVSTIGTPEEAVVHAYTFSRFELEALAEGLDRHQDFDRAHACRQLLSLRADGHTEPDQAMVSAVQPVLNDSFALKYPSQGLLAVVEQFNPSWTVLDLDPVEDRPGDAPALRTMFSYKFLNDRVPYLEDRPGIYAHVGRGPLAEAPPATDPVEDQPASPDGWYPIRKRAGGQFPLEYLWATTPKQPGDTEPRLSPAVVDEWGLDEEHRELYGQEIDRFRYRTRDREERLTSDDVAYLVERLSYALIRLVEAIPFKNAYLPKTPIDATALESFDLGVPDVPTAARDYLRMEHGARRDDLEALYRRPPPARARTGRSIPVRCTEYELTQAGGLRITAELAYDALFDDEATAAAVASQARVRGGGGAGGGSWRVLTPLAAPKDTQTPSNPSARGPSATDALESSAAIKHSPPVIVTDLDQADGTITLSAFPHRFQRNGSRFRVDHCGWQCPEASNLAEPDKPPAERSGYVAGRPPVWIEPGKLFMLDPMVDNFAAPKADRALAPPTIDANALWTHLDRLARHGVTTAPAPFDPDAIGSFLETVQAADGCLTPNEDQQAFIADVSHAVLPLQGPPGTGKTGGATAPALLGRAHSCAQADRPFLGVVVAPAHEAVDTVLSAVADRLAECQAGPGLLEDLELVRALPWTPAAQATGDAPASIDVTYTDYTSDAGRETLADLATRYAGRPAEAGDADAGQCLLFTTPATWYRVLGVFAEALEAVEGDSAPAAMRHDEGLVDLLCVDEGSMLDLPGLLLAGSALSPDGQTLLVGDHRQLATVSQHDWPAELRAPIQRYEPYRSALSYVRDLTDTDSQADHPASDDAPPDDADDRQSGGESP